MLTKSTDEDVAEKNKYIFQLSKQREQRRRCLCAPLFRPRLPYPSCPRLARIMHKIFADTETFLRATLDCFMFLIMRLVCAHKLNYTQAHTHKSTLPHTGTPSHTHCLTQSRTLPTCRCCLPRATRRMRNFGSPLQLCDKCGR